MHQLPLPTFDPTAEKLALAIAALQAIAGHALLNPNGQPHQIAWLARAFASEPIQIAINALRALEITEFPVGPGVFHLVDTSEETP